MPGMDSPVEEVGPTEDTILALLDFLVDPLLPSKSSSSRDISPSQQELVAKQVHAVVLLYNYYHRKRHPWLDFLDFSSFCKLAVAMKPSLRLYLKLMQKTDDSEVDDLDKQLSWTEKAIKTCCDICKSLDAAKNKPLIEGWPVNKVAVFLVDSKKENCFLFHSSITQGVWSVIEKDVNETEVRHGNKMNGVTKKAHRENRTSDEASLQQLANLAVKEACGIKQSDLKTLESHMVYSISKEKSAVQLFIMQCTQSNEDMSLVPINDAMESLQGPLVVKESGSWITTPVVEYFHLLPFADKVSSWLSREGLLSISQDFEVAKQDGNCNSSHFKVEQLPNASGHLEGVKEVERQNNSHVKVESLLNYSDHSESRKEDQEPKSRHSEVEPLPSQHFKAVTEVETQKSSCLEVKPVSNKLDHVEAVKKAENHEHSHLKVEQMPNNSGHFEAVNEAENQNSSHVEVELVLKSDHFESVKEVGNLNSSSLEVKPVPNNSDIIEPENEAVHHSSHVELKPVPNNSDHFEAVNEAENHNSSLLEVEPLQDTLHQYESLKEVEDEQSSYLEVEPLLKKSSPFKAAEKVENCNSSHIKEEPLLKTSHNSAVKLVESSQLRDLSHCKSYTIKEEVLQYTSGLSEAAREVEINNGICRRKERAETVVYRKRNRSQKGCNSNKNLGNMTSDEYLSQGNDKCAVTGLSENMDIDVSRITRQPADGSSKAVPREDHVDNQKQIVLVKETDQTASTEGAIVVAESFDHLPISCVHDAEKSFSDNKISDTAMSDQFVKEEHTRVSYGSSYDHLHKVQQTIASRQSLLSQTALKVLFRKREMLSQQLRSAADDIALCDRNIQIIVNGDADDLAVMLDSVLEGCNDVCLRSVTAAEDSSALQLSDKDFSPALKRKRLSEATLCSRSSCQELDGICNGNSWILPIYHVSVSEGGFQACVTVKGLDFECSSEGDICAAPLEARNSAASNILVKLRTMASRN